MPKFYEIRVFTGIGIIALIVFSIIAYFSGKILPLGLGLIPFPIILGLVLSIYYIKLSAENKTVHFLCFSIMPIIIAFFIGINVDIYETKNTEMKLIEIGNTIEEYKLNKGIEYLSEDDIKNIVIYENIRIEINEKTYRIFFKDGIFDSETKNVHFRSRP
jgi:hypothetical protein